MAWHGMAWHSKPCGRRSSAAAGPCCGGGRSRLGAAASPRARTPWHGIPYSMRAAHSHVAMLLCYATMLCYYAMQTPSPAPAGAPRPTARGGRRGRAGSCPTCNDIRRNDAALRHTGKMHRCDTRRWEVRPCDAYISYAMLCYVCYAMLCEGRATRTSAWRACRAACPPPRSSRAS